MVTGSRHTDLDHEDVYGMLGAYALDAVTEEERQRIEAHIATCPECTEELAYLIAAADVLPLAAEEREPPANLRDKIAAVSREPQQPSAAMTSPAEQTPEPAELGQYRERRGRGLTYFAPWVAAAMLLIAVVGLVAWNLQLRAELDDRPTFESIAIDTTGAEGVQAELLYMTEEQVIILDVLGLPQREEDEIYQVWLFQDGQPIPAGLFDEPVDLIALSAPLEQYEAVGVTIEPGPIGSPQPTSDPVLVSEIT